MANTKINLIGQSDQNLSGATIMSPVGIEMKDLSGLVENLDALSITDGEIQDKLDADISDEAKARKAADAQIAQDLSDYGTSNDAALAAEAKERIFTDAGLQTAIDLEKGRLDVILSGSQVDLNQFKEVVEFIETIDLQNDEDLLGAVTSINVDITANKVAAEDAVAAEEVARIAAVAAEKLRAETSEEELKDNISAEGKRAMQVEGQIQTELDEYKSSNNDALEAEVKRSTGVETALSAKTDEMIAQFTDGLRKEKEERKAGDDALDTKINDVVFNETPGMNSIYEVIEGVDRVMMANIYNFNPRRSEIGDYDSETGVVTLSKGYFEQTFMFFINGLMMDDGDYTSLYGNGESSEGVIGLELLGDAKTLADNGAKMVEYGTQAGDFTFLMEESKGEYGDRGGEATKQNQQQVVYEGQEIKQFAPDTYAVTDNMLAQQQQGYGVVAPNAEKDGLLSAYEASLLNLSAEGEGDGTKVPPAIVGEGEGSFTFEREVEGEGEGEGGESDLEEQMP